VALAEVVTHQIHQFLDIYQVLEAAVAAVVVHVNQDTEQVEQVEQQPLEQVAQVAQVLLHKTIMQEQLLVKQDKVELVKVQVVAVEDQPFG
jgi:hypothetical protein